MIALGFFTALLSVSAYSSDDLKVVSATWDSPSRSTRVRLSNGKTLDDIGSLQHLEHLQSIAVKDNQGKPLHVFLFKRESDAGDSSPDLLVYAYESKSSQTELDRVRFFEGYAILDRQEVSEKDFKASLAILPKTDCRELEKPGAGQK